MLHCISSRRRPVRVHRLWELPNHHLYYHFSQAVFIFYPRGCCTNKRRTTGTTSVGVRPFLKHNEHTFVAFGSRFVFWARRQDTRNNIFYSAPSCFSLLFLCQCVKSKSHNTHEKKDQSRRVLHKFRTHLTEDQRCFDRMWPFRIELTVALCEHHNVNFCRSLAGLMERLIEESISCFVWWFPPHFQALITKVVLH